MITREQTEQTICQLMEVEQLHVDMGGRYYLAEGAENYIGFDFEEAVVEVILIIEDRIESYTDLLPFELPITKTKVQILIDYMSQNNTEEKINQSLPKISQ